MHTLAIYPSQDVEGVICSSNGLLSWPLAIRLDSMFEAAEILADIANLNTSLANLGSDALMHGSYRLGSESDRSRHNTGYSPQQAKTPGK